MSTGATPQGGDDSPLRDPSGRRDGDQRWERILETSNDAFVGIDQHHTITEWNPAAERLFGWSTEEAIGRSLPATLIPEAFRERHLAGMQRFLEEGEGPVLFRPLEVTALHRSGRELPVELRIWPAQVDGEWRFYAFLRDLRGQRRAEAHMQLLAQVTETANRSVRAEEAVRAALSEICELTGWPVGHAYCIDEEAEDGAVLASSGWWHLGEDHDTFAAATSAQRFRAGEGLPGRVLQARRPLWSDLDSDDNFPRSDAARTDGLHSGFAFPVFTGATVAAVLEFYTRQSVDADGALLELVRQVGTQLGRVFERQRSMDELGAAAERRARMMAMLAHDVQTPLASVRGYAELLAEEIEEASPEELRHYATRIVENVGRLTRMVSSLLTGARAEAGRLAVHPGRVGLQDAVQQIATDLGLEGLELDVPGDATVWADADHVTQIVTNLLSNAQKYGEPPIEVTVREESDHVVLSITDHGPGLPDDLEEELFSPFTRGRGGMGVGSGLGLWIARQLAMQNGGDLVHEVPDGGGACFALALPRERTARGETAEVTPPSRPLGPQFP